MRQGFGVGSRYGLDALGVLATTPADFASRAAQVAVDEARWATAAAPVRGGVGDWRKHRPMGMWVRSAPFCVAGYINDYRAFSPVEQAMLAADSTARGGPTAAVDGGSGQ